MHITTIRSLPELINLEKEWNDLLVISASHVPFLRHEYITAWWQGLGGGEWSHGELNIITARSEDGNLIGIAPLFNTENRDGEPALMLLGSVEISDYLDLIARPEDIPAFLEAILEYLASTITPASNLLDWYNLLESSPTLPALQAAADKFGWMYSQQTLQHCPFIPLPGDWESYLSSIDKKQRHEIRRKMRRAEERCPPVRWYISQDPGAVDHEIDGFLGLMACDPDKAKFLTPAMRDQMRLIILAAHRAGWLQLAFIEVDGEKAAGYLNFDYMNHIWVYNSGLDFRFSELSLGWVLLGHLLEWANEHKRQYFDFMRGDERYKYQFGAVDRQVMRAMVRKSPAR
jgi:CelD/BcsL family acetyltransferase involved in cellulose biosynthesis